MTKSKARVLGIFGNCDWGLASLEGVRMAGCRRERAGEEGGALLGTIPYLLPVPPPPGRLGVQESLGGGVITAPLCLHPGSATEAVA